MVNNGLPDGWTGERHSKTRCTPIGCKVQDSSANLINRLKTLPMQGLDQQAVEQALREAESAASKAQDALPNVHKLPSAQCARQVVKWTNFSLPLIERAC